MLLRAAGTGGLLSPPAARQQAPQHAHHPPAAALIGAHRLQRQQRQQRSAFRCSAVAQQQDTAGTRGSPPRRGHGPRHAPRSPATAATTTTPTAAATQFYRWPGRGARRDHQIAYSVTGSGPVPLVLVHAFGACRSSWAKLLPELGPSRYTAFCVDLLGFGDSDKPAAPSDEAPPGAAGHLYSYETWAAQVVDFISDVVQAPAILVGNSAGALAALQAAVDAPQLMRGLVLLDCSMRSMHERKQPALLAPLISAWQWAVTSTPLGRAAVAAVLHQPALLRAILASAYGDASALSPELVASVTRHLAHPTSAGVILDVLANPRGVLPEDLLPRCVVPTVVIWGSLDPWESPRSAEALFAGNCVEFVLLPGVGHFPQDEVPAVVAGMLGHFADELDAKV